MGEKSTCSNNKMKCRGVISFFSGAALLLTIFSVFNLFIKAEYEYDVIIKSFEYKYKMSTPSLRDIATYFVGFVSQIFFFLCALGVMKDKKARISVSVFFGGESLLLFYKSYMILRLFLLYEETISAGSLLEMMIYLGLAVVCVLTIVKGIGKKSLNIFGILYSILQIIFAVFLLLGFANIYEWYFESGLFINIIFQLLSLGTKMCLGVSLLLFFCTERKKESSKIYVNENVAGEELPPDQLLRHLNYDKSNGTISEEEFQIKRAEIIKKL